MKKGALIVGVLIVLSFSHLAMAEPELLEVNGYLHDVNGQTVLHVWGSHYEMGYAQGYLLGDKIMRAMREYILELLPTSIYMAGHFVVPPLFNIPEDFKEEIHGVVDGVFRSNADTYIPVLNRHIDEWDLVFSNAVADLGSMACSTQIGWDEATSFDPRLVGETAMIRNLDWALAGPDRFMLSKETIVIVYTPEIAGRQTVASVTFPGFLGCLTCMNESGVAAALNIAHNGVPMWEINFAEKFTHSGFIIRQALEADDLNGYGGSSIQDVEDNIKNNVQSGALIVNLAEPRENTNGDPGAICEADNRGFTIRRPDDESGIPPDILLSTNDLRKLRETRQCDRYETLVKGVNDLGGHLTLQDMWDLEKLVLQDYILSTTVQTVYFFPNELEIGVSWSDEDAYSPNKIPAILAWEDLIEMPPGEEIEVEDDDEGEEEDEPLEECDTSGSEGDYCGCAY